eukprot:5104014-Pyramimonas_sp.AAC.1
MQHPRGVSGLPAPTPTRHAPHLGALTQTDASSHIRRDIGGNDKRTHRSTALAKAGNWIAATP